MQKIPTIFARNPEDRRYVTDEITPGCEWVFAGEGTAHRKFDGTCVMFSMLEGRWYARREVKPGKAAPPNFYLVEHDPVTGKSVGWEPIVQSSFAAFHAEAVANTFGGATPHNGTYELVGPKINGNPEPERLTSHRLVRHATADTPELLYDAHIGNDTPPMLLTRLVGAYGWEGLVWHHPDGRFAKLKARDLPPV